MNKKFVTLSILFFFFNQQILSGQNIQTPDQVRLSNIALPDINDKSNVEEESVIRRVEIVFLLSLPFTAIMSFLFINGVYYISDPLYKFTMADLPHEILPFTIFSAVFTSSIITYADFRTVQGKKNQPINPADKNETHELLLGAGLQKKF